MESEPLKGDFAAVKMNYGDLLKFYGNKCRHGNKVNQTDLTRVTFDFRILPLSKYKPGTYKKSGTQTEEFDVGSYYKEIA